MIAVRSLRFGVALLIALLLVACGGGGEGPSAAVSSQYTLGGSVSGLTGTGLVLQNNSGESLPISANGPFTFKTTLTSGSSYYVVTADQPAGPTQTCAVSNPTGTISSTNISDINVVCTDKANTAADTVGVTTTGITGAGLVLQNNGGDNLAVSADGSFKFALTVPNGSQYEVSVLSPPINPYQDCVVSNGSGTADGSDVANVVVSCSVNSNPTHTISGTITGVSGAIVLQDNGRDDITVTADGPFQFPLKIPQGSVYVVSTKSVAGGQSQTCQFQNARGIVGDHDVTDVALTCNANIAIKVAVSGLSGTGLVLVNGNEPLAISTNGTTSFPTPVPPGTPYSVAVSGQPTNPSQTCTVTNGAGTATGPVTVPVSCTTDQFAVGGTVIGLPDPDSTATIDLVVQNNLGDDVTIPVSSQSPTGFTFPTPIASGSNYSVTVKTQPGVDTSFGTPGVTQTSTVCLVSGGAGTVGNGPVTNVTVNCLRPSGFAYVTNGVDNTITEYIVDSASGLLLPLGVTVPTGSGPSCATAPASAWFYVCNQASNDLSAYTIDPNTGVLTQATGSPVALGVTAPRFAATQDYNNGVALYLTSSPAGATPGSVSAFAAGSTPIPLTPINQLATGVAPNSGLTFVGAGQTTTPSYFAALNSTDNTLSLFQVNATSGALTAFQSGVVTGTGPRDIVYHQGFDPADGGLFSDDLYVANSGDGTITQFVADDNTGLISQNGTPSTAGAGLHSLVVSGTDYLYASATQGVFGYAFGTAGTLVPMAGSPFTAGTNPGAIGALGNYVYVVNQTDETVSVFFSGAAAGGALTPIVPNTPITTGHGPVNIVVIPRPDFGAG